MSTAEFLLVSLASARGKGLVLLQEVDVDIVFRGSPRADYVLHGCRLRRCVQAEEPGDFAFLVDPCPDARFDPNQFAWVEQGSCPGAVELEKKIFG